MRKGISGARKRILVEKGVGFRGGRKGMRKRKTVCGDAINEKITQINLKITKYGAKKLEAPKKEAKEEKPKEAPKEEKPKEEAGTQTTKESDSSPKEAPKEEAKPEAPKEKPKEEKKEEPKKEAK